MRPIGDKLVIATHNPGKLREIAALLEPLGIACVGAEELGLPEPEEIGNTLRRQCRPEGARGGRPVAACPRSPTTAACASTRSTACPASSRRAGPRTRTATATGCARWRRVWREVEAAEPDAAPAAHFVCALAIAWPNDGQAETFEGRVDGTLVWPPRGDKGFGYDPMFVPVGHEQTFGELDPERSTASATAPTRSASWWRRSTNERRAAGALRPLAVLRQQMPLLRLQQPCPRAASTRTRGATRCSPTSRMRRGCCPAGG